MLPRPLKQQAGVNLVKFKASQSDVHPFGSEWMHFRYQNLYPRAILLVSVSPHAKSQQIKCYQDINFLPILSHSMYAF